MNIIDVSDRAAEILLIEDNPMDILLTKEAFRSFDIKYNLHIARDGDEALQILNCEGRFSDYPTPDLILLDLNLPKIDGREVLSKIKSSQRLKDIPVIVLSGSDTEIDITTSYDLHANSYVVKPESFEDLKEIVSSIQTYWFRMKQSKYVEKVLH